jgi:hypothetical protein
VTTAVSLRFCQRKSTVAAAPVAALSGESSGLAVTPKPGASLHNKGFKLTPRTGHFLKVILALSGCWWVKVSSAQLKPDPLGGEEKSHESNCKG